MVVVEIDLQLILGLVAGGLVALALVRKKLHELRVLFDAADDAVQDDKVTEAEFQSIWKALRALIGVAK